MLTRNLTAKEIWHALRKAGTTYDTRRHQAVQRTFSAAQVLGNAPGFGKKRCGEIAECVASRNRILDYWPNKGHKGFGLQDRLKFRIRQKVEGEAHWRRLPTVLDLKREGEARLQVRGYRFDPETKAHVMLLQAEGWAQYSRRTPRTFRKLAILGGVGPEGNWAVRVPGTIETIADAIDWLTPAAVKEAERKGKRVLRQGDVYLVERWQNRYAANEPLLPVNHRWDEATRTLNHPQHGSLHIPFNFRIYLQRALAGDGIGRIDGD
jgi:hypothetical protein